VKRVLAILAIIVIVVASFVALSAYWLLPKNLRKEEAYVGVTYCGDTVAGGKLLVDRMKGYANLFVLQSGTLQRDYASVDELGDYAISNGLYFLPYFGYLHTSFSSWLKNATERWGTKLLGVYYGDEPGGKMLDDYVEFTDPQTNCTITKTTYGDIVVQQPNGVVVHYQINGDIHYFQPANATAESNNSNAAPNTDIYSTFYPNGTIIATRTNTSALTSEPIANWQTALTYQGLMDCRPLKDADEVAERFCTNDQANIEYLKNSATVFTSDYALYWFDYLSGYDVVLAQIGWNNSFAQQVALERGAAKAFGRDWGIIITWKYDTSPYLASGSEIFSQMKTAYECGAKYFIIFSYYENQDNPYGTMQEEHFSALRDFWNQVVENPDEVQGSVHADAALVLPRNYGCGMRWETDRIWGVMEPNASSTQIWNVLQKNLEARGFRFDIVYDDPAFPLSADYAERIFWNQTG
jgi:hypothetical protein